MFDVDAPSVPTGSTDRSSSDRTPPSDGTGSESRSSVVRVLRWLAVVVAVGLGFAVLDARDESDGSGWGTLRRFQGASIRSGDGKGIHVKRNVKSNFHLCKKAFQKSKVRLAVTLGRGSTASGTDGEDDDAAASEEGEANAGSDDGEADDSRVERTRGYAD